MTNAAASVPIDMASNENATMLWELTDKAHKFKDR